MRKQIGSFIAKRDDGTAERIYIFENYTTTSPDLAPGQTDTIPMTLELQTASGRSVNRIAKGKYEIADVPPVPLTSKDPAAL